MAKLIVDGDALVVRLQWWERVIAGRRYLRVPHDTVRGIRFHQEPWLAVRGVRERGVLLPGLLCLGEWRHPGGRDFLTLRFRRGAVCVELREPAPFARIVVTAAGPQQSVLARRARAAGRARPVPGKPQAGGGTERPAGPVGVSSPRGCLQPG